MKVIGILSPCLGTEVVPIAASLYRVLEDAGLEVVTVDLDPRAPLTEVMAPTSSRRSIDDFLSSLLDDSTASFRSSIVETEGFAISGHPRALILDAHASDDESTLAEDFSSLVRDVARDLGADILVYNLPRNLGPFNRLMIESIDGLLLALAPEDADVVSRSIEHVLKHWTLWSKVLGLAVVGPPGLVRSTSATLVAPRIGAIFDYPGLGALARAARQSPLMLTNAHGATHAHLQAVRDLRRQYEELATGIVNRVELFEDDRFVEDLEGALFGMLLHGEMPSELDVLSSRTSLHSVADVEVSEVALHGRAVRVRGTASISVELEWGGGKARDGVESSASFPARFDVELDRSHEDVTHVHQLEVDTSSWYD